MDASDRLNQALATLKSDMISLRNQDVQLMKQMIGISDTINRMTKKRRPLRRIDDSISNLESETENDATPLIRVQSTPDYCGFRQGSRYTSISSNDEDISSSYEDLSTCSENSEDEGDTEDESTSPISFTATPSRRRSIEPLAVNFTGNDTNNAYYEDILKQNIKLWKDTNFISRDISLVDEKLLEEDEASLRGQDVTLMKQMIGINDTIRRISRRSRRNCPGTDEVDKTEGAVGSQETPLIRVQSIPDYCEMQRNSPSGSISSNDDVFSSCEDLTSCSEDGDSEDLSTPSPCFLTVPSFNRRRSISPYGQRRNSTTSDDSYYEDILKKNIKLWKHSKSISNESLNSLLSDEELSKEDTVGN